MYKDLPIPIATNVLLLDRAIEIIGLLMPSDIVFISAISSVDHSFAVRSVEAEKYSTGLFNILF